ncbi:MAG: hypothetical protein HYR96_03540 [Deltaproteobacteria bacterium]|nr:hypothetical protein [Deltaproteobacteria bacterium]MBI3295190.1 hypothetical protein [Deltaproteobacteria bacterium]
MLRVTLITVFGLWMSTALCGPKEADSSEKTFRQYWADRFATFTQEQNVPGLGSTPDGNQAIAGKKVRGNHDDGFQYEGYLTYHDFAFDTDEDVLKSSKTNPNDPNAKESRKLYANISPHGAVSAAGGSSLLERTVYQQHEKYMKQQEEARKNGKPADDDKTGTEFKSIFKVETKQVMLDPDSGNSGNNPDKPEKKKVERWYLRDDVKTEVEKAGDEAAKTVEAAARSQGSENDENALSNSTLLYETAGRAYDAWWNSSLANVTQARVNRTVKGRVAGSRMKAQLNEDIASCDDWATKAKNEIKKMGNPQGGSQGSNDSQKDEQEIDRMLNQCKEMVTASYANIDPEFKQDPEKPDAPKELKSLGPAEEKARERDQRVQLEILADAQKKPSEVQSNWQYTEDDAKAKVTIAYDENAKSPQQTDMTVKDQVDSYNNQVQEAAKALDEVKKRLPTLDTTSEQVLQYQIKGNLSAKEISALPQELYEDDTGVKKSTTAATPGSYNQLMNRKVPASR